MQNDPCQVTGVKRLTKVRVLKGTFNIKHTERSASIHLLLESRHYAWKEESKECQDS